MSGRAERGAQLVQRRDGAQRGREGLGLEHNGNIESATQPRSRVGICAMRLRRPKLSTGAAALFVADMPEPAVATGAGCL